MPQIQNLAAFFLLALAPLHALADAGGVAASTITTRATIGGPTPLAGRAAVMQAAKEVGTPVDFSVLPHWMGNQSDANHLVTYVVREQSEWESLWRTIGRDEPFSFSRDKLAIAIFLGPKPSEGYSIGIASIRRDGEDMYVRYVVNKPGERNRVGQPTSPWFVQVLPPTTGRVRFSLLATN